MNDNADPSPLYRVELQRPAGTWSRLPYQPASRIRAEAIAGEWWQATTRIVRVEREAA